MPGDRALQHVIDHHSSRNAVETPRKRSKMQIRWNSQVSGECMAKEDTVVATMEGGPERWQRSKARDVRRQHGRILAVPYLEHIHATPFPSCALKKGSRGLRVALQIRRRRAPTTRACAHDRTRPGAASSSPSAVSRTFCCRSIQRSPLLGVSQLVFLLLKMHGKLVIAVAAGQLQ